MLSAPRVGLIEGFYGKPWSHPARLAMLAFLGEIGLGWYVHAPKNDPKHRARWRAPYDAAELAEFAELARVGRVSDVRVTVALAPQRLFGRGNLRARGDRDGDGIDDAQWFDLLHKVQSLIDVGIQHFALFFDDTLATFLPLLATRKLGAFHARAANRLWSALTPQLPEASLLVTPSVYFGRFATMGRGERAYYEGLSALDPRIEVAWTGPGMFSRRISGEDARALAAGTGLRIVVWNNVITNDYLPLASGGVVGLSGIQKLSFGPPENMTPDLPEHVEGILLNAAREPELTKVALSCMAQFVRAPHAYEPASAHTQAIARVAGADGAETLRRLYDLTQRHHLTTRERIEGARLRHAMRAYRQGERTSQVVIEAELAALAELLAASERAMGHHPLWEEVAPTLEKIDLLARAGLAGLDRARAVERADPAAARTHREVGLRYLARARKIRWQVGLAVERWVGG